MEKNLQTTLFFCLCVLLFLLCLFVVIACSSQRQGGYWIFVSGKLGILSRQRDMSKENTDVIWHELAKYTGFHAMLTSICLGSQSRFTQKCFSTKHLERKLICIPKKHKVKMFFSDKNVGDFPTCPTRWFNDLVFRGWVWSVHVGRACGCFGFFVDLAMAGALIHGTSLRQEEGIAKSK